MNNQTLKNLSIIVAIDNKNRIGNCENNSLLEHIPSDLKYFAKRTVSNAIVMGFKTYESIGKILPRRFNIILTHRNYDIDFEKKENYWIANDINSILDYAQKNPETEIFICGGASVYKQFFPYVSKMYITEIDHDFNIEEKNSVYFPEYDKSEWFLESSYGIYDKYYLKFNTYNKTK